LGLGKDVKGDDEKKFKGPIPRQEIKEGRAKKKKEGIPPGRGRSFRRDPKKPAGKDDNYSPARLKRKKKELERFSKEGGVTGKKKKKKKKRCVRKGRSVGKKKRTGRARNGRGSAFKKL